MKVNVHTKVRYPSAELLIQPCMEDYKYQLESYNRIYDKVNVAMALCSAVLFAILSSVDFKYVPVILGATTAGKFFRSAIPFASSLGSAVFIAISTVQLLNLMASRKLTIFDSVAFRNEHCYFDPAEKTAFLLVVSYTNATHNLRATVHEKQTAYDKAVKSMIVAIVLFSVYTVLRSL
jgi:hypothetical protein